MASRDVVVTGLGVISPLGDDPAAFVAALLEGRSALKPIELFDPAVLSTRFGGEIRPFSPELYLGDRNLRPLDRTSRLLISAVSRALEDSGWTEEGRGDRELSLAVGTTYCSVHTISEFDRRGLKLGPNYVSPFDFANSVINAAAGQAAIWHKLTGVNSTLAGGEASGLQAIAYAADLIRSGQTDVVLAAGVEELCFESALGYSRAGRLCGDPGRPIPFDARHDGFAPAEGAGVLVLEAAEIAAERGAKVLARVVSSGAAFSPARPGTAEATDRGNALARAIATALSEGGAERLVCVASGASGAVELDRREASGIACGLEMAGSRPVPVSAIKSTTGEALGASGPFQAISLIATLGDGRLPGIAGLESVDDTVGLDLSSAARTIEIEPGALGLATAFAAEGTAIAVALAAP